MRATLHFYRGLLLGKTRIKRKEIQRNTLKYFWSSSFFYKKANKEGKNKNENNYIHGKAPNKQKKNTEIFLGFLFRITTKYA